MFAASNVLETTRFPTPKWATLRTKLNAETLACPQAMKRCRLSTQAMFIRSAAFLLVLAVATVSATGQVQQLPVVQKLPVVPPQQQQWAPRTADRSPARTVRPQTVAAAGSVGQPVADVSQVRFVADSTPEPLKTQQQTDGAPAEDSTKSKPAPFIDLTNEGLDSATAGTTEPTHIDMLIRLGTWTVISCAYVV
ncbi:MAG: hypothetical protein ABGZ53_09180 [Fuerstiella sp.]